MKKENMIIFGIGFASALSISIVIDIVGGKKKKEVKAEEDCAEEIAIGKNSQTIKNKESVMEYLKIIKEKQYSSPDSFVNKGNDVDEDEDAEDDDEEIENEDGTMTYINKETGEEVFEVKSKVNENIPPRIISPEEFGDQDGYELISLIYFSDGVVTDTDYKRITDINDLIGPDALREFDEHEIDSVFVRNDNYEADYEILFDNRKYKSATRRAPKPHEV